MSGVSEVDRQSIYISMINIYTDKNPIQSSCMEKKYSSYITLVFLSTVLKK